MTQLMRAKLEEYKLPRKLVLLADMGIITGSFLIAYVLFYNLDIDQISFARVLLQMILIIFPSYLAAFLWSGSYRGIIRHSSIEDAVRFSKAICIAAGIALVLTAILKITDVAVYWDLSNSVIIIHAAMSSALLMGFRIIVRGIYRLYINPQDRLRPVLIFGAGDMGQIALQVIENDKNSGKKVIGFIDDNKVLIGKRLADRIIYSEDEAFEKVIDNKKILEIILAVSPQNIHPNRKKVLFDRCLKQGLKIHEVPPVTDWIDGKFSTGQIRELRIEDLLGREPIVLNQDKISKGLKDSVVLVTGAAGSIGSEIARQLMLFEMQQVILLDQAESPLYDLQNELQKKFPGDKFSIVIASVTDRCRMRHVFEKYRPQYVFNAAAYKHVPLMESAPYEAIRVNVGGTRLLADLSVRFGVKKFVMISTDKAVNPTNVMGASKRICEIYIQALTQFNHISTQFITTRFGNVLGSNGSVVPLFRKQIEEGGPVTVTHPDIIRYFMTIPEACQLVLEAGFMGHGGEIYVFDMGEPVKIYDLAVKMISLAGLKPKIDIPILFTGLRPGEKLYEELLTDEENTIQTHHPKIKAAKVCKHDFGIIKLAVDELLKATQTESEEKIVSRMKNLVPEFISQNSKYCVF
jgi:FlaA1/EpsC-like NDP-sugar epimerase